MILPDINLLLYASFTEYQEHQKSKAWWDGVLSSPVPTKLGHVVILGFLRLSTNPRIYETPYSMDEAVDIVESWLDQPNTELLCPSSGHWGNMKSMLAVSGVMGNLATDAHIAALALDYGLTIYSNDTDFHRFPGVRVVNPLA